MTIIVRKALLILCLGLPIGPHAATSGFGSWFKRKIADPITDASDIVYRAASNGVETVVDAASNASIYIYEKTSNGVEMISRKVTETAMDVWVVTNDGLVYVGKKKWEGTMWVATKYIDAKRWLESEFKSNTEGTMTFTMPIALSKNGTDYLATQIFGLSDFNEAKAKFTTFDFNQAYVDIPSGMSSGRLTWWIECYESADCSRFNIFDNQAFTPGSRLSTNASDWKANVVALLNLKNPDGTLKAPEAVMGFEITGYGSSPSYVEIKYGFEAGMKGVK